MGKLVFEQIEDAKEIVWDTWQELQTYEEPTAVELELIREVGDVHDQLIVLGRRVKALSTSYLHAIKKIESASTFLANNAGYTLAEKDVAAALDSALTILRTLAESADSTESNDKSEVTISRCWVIGSDGNVYVQEPEDNQWGFSLADGESTWAGGLIPGLSSWETVEEDDVRITQEHRDAMEWLFDEPPSPDH